MGTLLSGSFAAENTGHRLVNGFQVYTHARANSQLTQQDLVLFTARLSAGKLTALVLGDVGGLGRRRRRAAIAKQAMQNDHNELWCLMHWAVPGCLGECKAFVSYYARAMKLAQRFDADERALALGTRRGRQLKSQLDLYLLRRTKADVLKDQLPKKRDNIVFCQMSDLQQRAYKRVLVRARTVHACLVRHKSKLIRCFWELFSARQL